MIKLQEQSHSLVGGSCGATGVSSFKGDHVSGAGAVLGKHDPTTIFYIGGGGSHTEANLAALHRYRCGSGGIFLE